MKSDSEPDSVPVLTSSSLKDFLKRHSMSRNMWNTLQKQGRGPEYYRVGPTTIRISSTAEEKWLRSMESPPKAEAEKMKKAVEAHAAQARAAAFKGAASPEHIAKRKAAKAGA